MSSSASQKSASILAYRPQLDGLRFIAVFVVICYHFFPALQAHNSPMDIGVLLAFFFVLSSYLITKIILIGKQKGLEGGYNKFQVGGIFLIRRTLRIFPAYYAYLLLLMFIPGLGENIWAYTKTYFFYLTNYHFFYQQEWGPLTGHLWTLAVEEQFYLVWPWLILFTPNRHIPKALVLMVVVGIVSRLVLFNQYDASGSLITMQILTQTCLDSFAFGGILAYLHMKGKDRNPVFVYLFFLSLFTWTACILFDYPHIATALGRVVVALLAMVVIEGANKGYTNLLGKVLENKVILYMAKISYGIYLYHLFSNFVVLQVAELLQRGNHHIIRFTGINVNNFLYLLYNPLIYFILSFSASVIMAALSWHFLEEPVNNLKRFFIYRKKAKTTVPEEIKTDPVLK